MSAFREEPREGEFVNKRAPSLARMPIWKKKQTMSTCVSRLTITSSNSLVTTSRVILTHANSRLAQKIKGTDRADRESDEWNNREWRNRAHTYRYYFEIPAGASLSRQNRPFNFNECERKKLDIQSGSHRRGINRRAYEQNNTTGDVLWDEIHIVSTNVITTWTRKREDKNRNRSSREIWWPPRADGRKWSFHCRVKREAFLRFVCM